MTSVYRSICLLFVLLMTVSMPAHAEDATKVEVKTKAERYTTPPKKWGLGIGLRTADIPFKTAENKVQDILPLFFYEGEHLFLEGMGIGFRFHLTEKLDVAVVARYRLFDIPAEYQNQIRGHAIDMGGQLRYFFTDTLRSDVELLIDQRGHTHATGSLRYIYEAGRWDVQPYGRLRWKSSGFNNLYYGLGIDEPGSAIDLSIGVEAKVQIYKELHLIGRVAVTRLDDDTYNASTIAERTHVESFLGVGFFNDKNRPVSRLKSKRYLRLAHGLATPSNLSDIISFNAEKDPYNNKLTSLFYGHPLSDTLFGWQIPVYLTPGLVYHHSSEVQDSSWEYVMAFKLYYTFKLPVRLRFGVAEGLSFADGIPYVERTELGGKGYRPSKLLNYLDFSLDLSLGDLFRSRSLEDLWLGYSIHHRSGIFESSSAFGRIKGGSNFQTLYLQWHF